MPATLAPIIQAANATLILHGDVDAGPQFFQPDNRAHLTGRDMRGRELVWLDMVVSEFRDSKIAEEWVVSDLAERLLLARKSK